eukprot:766389-Hanusia_phi.AAC.6
MDSVPEGQGHAEEKTVLEFVHVIGVVRQSMWETCVKLNDVRAELAPRIRSWNAITEELALMASGLREFRDASNTPLTKCCSYTDTDCATPSQYSLSSISPRTGPVAGKTPITLRGAALERIIAWNNFIIDWQSASNRVTLYCKFHSYDNPDLEDQTSQIVRVGLESDESLTTFVLVGDEVTVYGCNPCDPRGVDGWLVAGVRGRIGKAPMELHFYDYYNDGDKLNCFAPPAQHTGVRGITVGGATAGSVEIRGADIAVEGSTANFEYYAPQSKAPRLNPSFSPLRPIGFDRGPQDINRPTTITVTGSYFPQSGSFICRFFDPDSMDEQCQSQGSYFNSATILCPVPQMKRAKKLIVYTSSNGFHFEMVGTSFFVYAVLSINPVCVPALGKAIITVRGVNLVISSSSGQIWTPYCRFGRVAASSGTTSNNNLTKWWAYHSAAYPSGSTAGALECRAPPAGILLEANDFSLSLDACECGSRDCPSCLKVYHPPLGGQNYFYGQWDSTEGPWQNMYCVATDVKCSDVECRTGLPTVLFHTVPGPTLVSITPSAGFVTGGTWITFIGYDLSFPACPTTLNKWPSCRFGSAVSTQVHVFNSTAISCRSPELQIRMEIIVSTEIAIDGQSYVGSCPFQYILPYGVASSYPSLGPSKGGTRIILQG